MPRAPARSFVARIRDSLTDLPPTERRLGTFLLDFPGELASYTASELAGLANVSNATVSRFIKRLGYDSFETARRVVRLEKQGGAALLLATPGDPARADGLDLHRQQVHRNIDATFNRFSEQTIGAIARAIVGAEQVWICGERSSRPFATYLRWQILQVVERTRVVPEAGETLGEYLPAMSRRDCVVLFGLNRRVARFTAMLEAVIATGARTLCITDRRDDPGPRPEWLIRCETGAPGPLYDHAAVTALCDVLATGVLRLAGASGRRRLSAIEAAHDALEEIEKL